MIVADYLAIVAADQLAKIDGKTSLTSIYML